MYKYESCTWNTHEVPLVFEEMYIWAVLRVLKLQNVVIWIEKKKKILILVYIFYCFYDQVAFSQHRNELERSWSSVATGYKVFVFSSTLLGKVPCKALSGLSWQLTLSLFVSFSQMITLIEFTPAAQSALPSVMISSTSRDRPKVMPFSLTTQLNLHIVLERVERYPGCQSDKILLIQMTSWFVCSHNCKLITIKIRFSYWIIS